MIFKILVSLTIIALIPIGTNADLFSSRDKRQSGGGGGNCPGGGCSCVCNCGSSGGGGGGGTTCPPCPPTMMPMTTTTMGGGMGNMTTMNPNGGGTGAPPTGAPSQALCFQQIRAAANLDAGSLIGLLLTTLLGNLVMPILQIVLTGNNTVEGAVIPLANILCFIVGIVLLLLRSLGLLGLLGMNGLLQNILGQLG